MRTLIVDGYNAIYAIPEMEQVLDESLQAAREALAMRLSELAGARGDIERVFVIFDGKGDFGDEEVAVAGGVRAIFTRSGKEADRKILDIIKSSPRPEDITVISNDNFVFNNARAHGARVEPVKRLMAMLDKMDMEI